MIGRTDVVSNDRSTTISCTALCTGRALPGNEAVRLQTGGGRCPRNFSKIGITEFFDVFMNVVEVVEMDLLFVDDRFKRFHAGAITVLSAHQEELVIGVDGIILELCVKRKDCLGVLTLLVLPHMLCRRFPAQFL